MQDDESVPEHVKRLQTKFFGYGQAGASLSACNLTNVDGEKVLKWLKDRKGILLICGNPGCGKTYLCSAILSHMYGKVADIYGFRESAFLARIRSSMDNSGDYQREIEYQSDHSLIFFDDLGCTGKGKSNHENDDPTKMTWRQEVISEFINIRFESQLPTVVTSNLNWNQINNNLGPRTYSRLFSDRNTYVDMFQYKDLRKPIFGDATLEFKGNP